MDAQNANKERIDEDFEILDRIFDNILEIDYKEQTMRCAKWSEDTAAIVPENIRMVLNDAVNFLVDNIAAERDRENLHLFFNKVRENPASYSDIRFHIINRDGTENLCSGELICTRYCCWLCFNNIEKMRSKLNAASDFNGETANGSKVSVHTFGYFDVFVDEKAVLFRSKKAKELLALLVDRRGGYVSSNEAISCLWEDESIDGKTLSRYRKVAMRLNETLKEYGIENIVENIDGNRRIVPEKVSCDLFNYLSDREKNRTLFNGTYMLNYSWGEVTLAGL